MHRSMSVYVGFLKQRIHYLTNRDFALTPGRAVHIVQPAEGHRLPESIPAALTADMQMIKFLRI